MESSAILNGRKWLQNRFQELSQVTTTSGSYYDHDLKIFALL